MDFKRKIGGFMLAKVFYKTALLFAGLGLLSQIASPGADLKVVDKAPPSQLDPSVQKLLQAKAVQLLEGEKPLFEFWFANELPLSSKPESPAKALDALKQSTLLGAVAVATDTRDYRDDEMPAGTYTLRFSLQPQDGNHLGTSEYLYFATLVAAKYDKTPDGLATYKALVKASSKDTSTDHPIILSMRPASSDEGSLPKLNEPAPDHQSIRVQVPAKVAGQDDRINLVFEVVYKGVAKK